MFRSKRFVYLSIGAATAILAAEALAICEYKSIDGWWHGESSSETLGGNSRDDTRLTQLSSPWWTPGSSTSSNLDDIRLRQLRREREDIEETIAMLQRKINDPGLSANDEKRLSNEIRNQMEELRLNSEATVFTITAVRLKRD